MTESNFIFSTGGAKFNMKDANDRRFFVINVAPQTEADRLERRSPKITITLSPLASALLRELPL